MSHQDQGSASRGVTPGRYPRPEEVAEEVVEAEEAKEVEMVKTKGVTGAEAVMVKRHTSTAMNTPQNQKVHSLCVIFHFN